MPELFSSETGSASQTSQNRNEEAANQEGNALALVSPDILYTLLALVPKLTATNYREILSTADRDRLYGLLYPAIIGSYGFDRIKLYREIVVTLERVGDTRGMNMLHQVAVMAAPTDGAKQLRTAAQEAMRVLRRQIEKEKVSKTLLRASSAPENLPWELLRPAAPTESETEPTELLRASGSGTDVPLTLALMRQEASIDGWIKGIKESKR
jgi:hypothetical protein